jgi:hypothetical protein
MQMTREQQAKHNGAMLLLANTAGEFRNYLSPLQRHTLLEFVRRKVEEWEFFADKIIEYAERIDTMSKTYEQDGKGDDAIVYLHYFMGGFDWWITEKDKDWTPGDYDQAYGLAKFPGNSPDLGYISIKEITEAGAELDLHWTPKPLKEVRK